MGAAVRDLERWRVAAVSVFLAVGVWVVFGQTLQHDFVNYDDDAYVYDNPAVTRGVTLRGVAEAFSQSDARLWTPLTRLSHMVDCQLFGLKPWGHHLTNVLLHAASAILLFLTLRQMTAAVWRSAFVAAVFALHPLRVESVAWISERKDTLSGLFFVLTLLAYTRYVQRRSSRAWYLSVIGLFGLGLLAKPMLVTLPFVLLLLDYWPLKRVADARLQMADWWPLVLEKLPLFALTALSLWFILFDPFALNGPPPAIIQPALSLRLSNAAVSYAAYIWQMFYPAGLAVRYPFPIDGLPVTWVAASLALLIAVSVAVYLARRRRPYLLVGWLWYLGMLVPVSQVVTLGTEARCDRYTYLPQIGLYIMVAWGVADLLKSRPYRGVVSGSAAAVILTLLGARAHSQAAHWKDSVSLWTHTAATAEPDWLTYNHLGLAMAAEGRFADAIRYYQQALQGNPEPAYAENNLGIALVGAGDLSAAARHLERALSLKPQYAEAHDNLGLVLARQGQLDDAIRHFRLALAAKPDLAQAHNNIGMVLAMKGQVTEAMQSYKRALQHRPHYAAAHINLGVLLAGNGQLAQAIGHYERATKIEPESAGPVNNLAWVLATAPDAALRNGARAVELARKADRLAGGNDPMILDTLSAAYAEAGEYAKAVDSATRAIELLTSRGDKMLADQIAARRELYRSGEPFRDRG